MKFILFISRALTEGEINYSAKKRELLGIIIALSVFGQIYLQLESMFSRRVEIRISPVYSPDDNWNKFIEWY